MDWMLNSELRIEVARKAQQLCLPDKLVRANELLGTLELDGKTVNAWVVHAVDSVITDMQSVVVISRANAPGKGMPALPGGFLDNIRDGVESVLQTAVREPLEEVGLKLNLKDAVIVGARNMYRPHDVRIAKKPLDNYGIATGDVFMVSTQAVRFLVDSSLFKQLRAGDDALENSARAMLISSITRDTFGIPDHWDSLQQSLNFSPYQSVKL